MRECPSCGQSIDYVKGVDTEDATPGVGDVSVCASCGELAVYTGVGLEVTMPTEAERAVLLQEEVVRTAVSQRQRWGYLWSPV